MDLPIIFLDFDGVVNTIYWKKDANGICCYNVMKGGHTELNNQQAIGWLNELYTKVPYDIVITSTWRISMSVEELQYLLIKSGFRPEIKVIGKTPVLHKERGIEIQQWIDENQFTGDFVIIDDDSDMGELLPKLIKCDTYIGFTIHDYHKSLKLLQNS